MTLATLKKILMVCSKYSPITSHVISQPAIKTTPQGELLLRHISSVLMHKNKISTPEIWQSSPWRGLNYHWTWFKLLFAQNNSKKDQNLKSNTNHVQFRFLQSPNKEKLLASQQRKDKLKINVEISIDLKNWKKDLLSFNKE